MNESKMISGPPLNSDEIAKNNGIISIQEDLEFKLNAQSNKLSIGVYSSRTFKEDILLFFNDVSLKKALKSE
jgi:hypothetical protein